MLSGYRNQGLFSGLDTIDGHWANSGENRPAIQPGELNNGDRYRLLVSMRLLGQDQVSVDVSLDGRPYLPHWEGSITSFNVRAEWTLPVPKRPGLGVWQGNVVFHSVRLRMISGTATPGAAA